MKLKVFVALIDS